MSLNNEGVVNVWDVQTGEKLRSLKEDRSPVSSLAWSPDGKTLASGLENGDINIWEVASGKKLQSFHDPKGIICSVDWSPDGKKLVSGGRRTIVIWDTETGKQSQTLSNQTQQDTEVVWSPNGSLLASISYEGYNSGGIIWDASTGEKLLTLKGNEFTVGVSWSPQGDLLGTSYPAPETGGERVTLWNPETGEAVITKVGLHDIVWSPIGSTIASRFNDRTIELWDARTGDLVKRITPGVFVYYVKWSPDGNYLVVAQDDERSLIVLNAQSGEQLHVLKGHADYVRDIEWSPDGDLIASASTDGTVIIWEIDTR
jgi:WD40 repeat protein